MKRKADKISHYMKLNTASLGLIDGVHRYSCITDTRLIAIGYA